MRRAGVGGCAASVLMMLGCLQGPAQPPAAAPPAGKSPDSAPAPPERFGFSGIEIYKVDEGTSRLRCLDVDGDGANDLVVVNNTRATIDFFLQKTPAEIAASTAKPVEYDNINEIASDARFRKESFLTEKRVFDLLLDDLNGDGRPDLAYYGDPKELVVVPRTATGWSDARQRFPIGEARAFGRGLAAGDLDGDGRTDLILLGGEKSYLFSQGADGKLAEPREIPNSEKNFSALAVVDLDGDGRKDLLLVGAGQVEPLRVRFQGPSGLGPEVAVETAAFRSHLVVDVDGDGQPEIAVVQEATGRLILFRLESAVPEDAVSLGRIRLFPLRSGENAERQVVTPGDVDGDGRADVLVTVPGAAQFDLYRQGPGGHLLPPESFPTLAGSAGTRIGDLDGDGRPEVICLSAEEKAVGVSRWDGTRLAFPKSLPLKGKPASCDLADLDGRKGDELAVAVEEDEGKSIRFFTGGEPLAPVGEALKLEGAKDAPERLAFFDANQDGRVDLLVFFPYETVRVYLQEAPAPGASSGAAPGAEGTIPRFADVSDRKDFGRGLLQGAVAASLAGGDPDGDGKPEFLLAKKGFARALRVTASGTLEVADQFNARDPKADIAGTACADLTGDGRPEVVLLDKALNQLWVLARGAKGTYEVGREIKIPAFRYRGLAVADLNGDGRGDLLVAGDDRFGVLPAAGNDYRLKRVGQYETELKDARLDLIAAGDLNADGRPDLLVSELSKHLLEILTPSPGREEIARATRFNVFEEKPGGGMLRDEGKGGREPREIAIADVTGDGKQDVVLLVHDRILVYPQE